MSCPRVCVCDLRMLCVCLSDAELIEVIGGAHAEAERWQKKKALNRLPAQHTAKKNLPPLCTLMIHTHAHIQRCTHICNQTDALIPGFQ